MYKTHLQLDKTSVSLIGVGLVFAILLVLNVVVSITQIAQVYFYKMPQASATAIDAAAVEKAVKILQEQ